MNEIVKQLLDESTQTIEIVDPDTKITHHRSFIDQEEFVKMIIEEIQRQCWQEWFCDALEDIVYDRLPKHFGLTS